MIDKNYIFPYFLSDGVGKCARWEGDVLSMTFFVYYTNDKTPNVIEVKFHGVEWIRSTTLKKYPCAEDEWDILEYEESKPITDYLLIERDWFNNDYEEFMSGNGFGRNSIRAIEDNVLFIDDRIIFACTKIEVVNTMCVKNVKIVEERFLKEFNKNYNRNSK